MCELYMIGQGSVIDYVRECQRPTNLMDRKMDWDLGVFANEQIHKTLIPAHLLAKRCVEP